MSGARPDRSELGAHQSRTQDANSHAASPYRPVLRSSSSGYRAPATVIFEAALSISRRSSDASSIATAPMFSSRRLSFVVPYDVAEVGAVEARVLVDLPREEAFPKGTKWNESDSQFLEHRNNLLFRAPPPQRIFALKRGDSLDRVGATYRLHTRLGKTEVPDLACLGQIFHRSRHVLDGYVGINAVLIEQVDPVGLESFE